MGTNMKLSRFVYLLLPLLFPFMSHANELDAIIKEKVKEQQVSHHVENVPVMQRYGLLLFFSDECHYCQQFAPVLKAFTTSHHIMVRAISLTGRGLPSFPHPIQPTKRTIDHFYGTSPVTYPSL